MKNNKQTTLDLNGPILGFTLNPTGVAVTGVLSGTGSGIATFTGIATATFNTIGNVSNTASNTGYITYRWHEVGIGALSDSTYVTGTATTTLTITNLITPTDNQKQYYLEADYIASAYGTVGSARSTGNAINKPLDSSIGILTVLPLIEIVDQPIDKQAIVNTNTTFTIDASLSDSFFGTGVSYQWQLNGQNIDDGVVTTTTAATRNTTVSGTKTPTLTIKCDIVGIQTVRCIITNINASNSPLLSSVVNFSTITDAGQYNINVENIGTTELATLSPMNLFDAEYVFEITDNFYYYSFYAPDKDINVEMDLYGGKGTDVGSSLGGEGGFSRVRFTLIRNTEYVIFGLSAIVNTPFVYRKGQLIATVGGGGYAGATNRGGDGGGIGIGGQNGSGRNGGSGGRVIAEGQLTSNFGIFGSGTTLTAIGGDLKAAAPNGGRVLCCTKGIYWKKQGVSACSDVGTTQFRLSNGTTVKNTGTIVRGYKAGYGINETFGASFVYGERPGRGGSGATGGSGGAGSGFGYNDDGGGGGSGYTDGSVTVVSTQQGGSKGNAKVIIRYTQVRI